ncbi:MAG TPA: PilZ domain-containing protein [Candidatus Acidoferrum sp.]|nr:PilZ domain-containing protein [Candidatus Acidoferrum sp.]
MLQQRRFPRVSLPKGMSVAWYGNDLQLFSSVQTIGMGGLFISTPNPAPVGTKLRLAFQVPGGNVQPEAIVRDVAPGKGMGVEFTRMEWKEQILLQDLMDRLLR